MFDIEIIFCYLNIIFKCLYCYIILFILKLYKKVCWSSLYLFKLLGGGFVFLSLIFCDDVGREEFFEDIEYCLVDFYNN